MACIHVVWSSYRTHVASAPPANLIMPCPTTYCVHTCNIVVLCMYSWHVMTPHYIMSNEGPSRVDARPWPAGISDDWNVGSLRGGHGSKSPSPAAQPR